MNEINVIIINRSMDKNILKISHVNVRKRRYIIPIVVILKITQILKVNHVRNDILIQLSTHAYKSFGKLC